MLEPMRYTVRYTAKTGEVLVRDLDCAGPDEVRAVEALSKEVGRAIEQVLGLGVKLRLMSPGAIERSEGKSKRVIDKRNTEA